MSLALRRFLFNSYGGFGDKRVKDINRDYPFKLDDQSPSDKHEHFCGVFARVHGTDHFTLSLTNHCPLDAEIEAAVTARGGRVTKHDLATALDVDLSVDDVDFVEELGARIRRLVAPGRRYVNPNWKWVCPRTADSLQRFAEALRQYRKQAG